MTEEFGRDYAKLFIEYIIHQELIQSLPSYWSNAEVKLFDLEAEPLFITELAGEPREKIIKWLRWDCAVFLVDLRQRLEETAHGRIVLRMSDLIIQLFPGPDPLKK
jgi:hypothetical protein